VKTVKHFSGLVGESKVQNNSIYLN